MTPKHEERARRRPRAARPLGKTGWGMTRASTPSSASASRPRSLCTTTRSKRPQQPPPEPRFERRSPRQQVVRGEDRRRAEPRRRASTCGSASHCTCSDVRPRAARASASTARCSTAFSGSRRRERAEEPRRERIEALACAGSRPAPGGVAEAEARGDELDVRARPRERGGELVVVPRRERRRVGETTRTRSSVDGVLVRSWNLFHGNALPAERRAFLDEMIALATADDPDVALPAGGAGLGARPVHGAATSPRRPRVGPLPIRRPSVGRRSPHSTTACSARPSRARETRSSSRPDCGPRARRLDR